MKPNKNNEQYFLNLIDNKSMTITKEGNVYNKNNIKIGYINRDYYMIEHRKHTIFIHRLMYLYFVGEIPENYVINHKDNNKLNNHIDNLEAITYSENTKQSYNSDRGKSKKIKNVGDLPEKNIPKTKIDEIVGEYSDKEKYILQLVYDGDIVCSKLGNVYNTKTNNIVGNGLVGGYKRLVIKNHSMFVHRLIYLVFKESIPNGYVINHKDGNKLNNHIDNLEAITITENNRHAFDNKLMVPNRGEECRLSKLTNNDIEKIRELYKIGGYSYRQIGKIFDVSHTLIRYILNNKLWTHIEGFNYDHILKNKKIELKLTENDVKEIRQLYKTELYSLDEIAKIFNVCFQNISLIINHKTWKNV